MELVYLWVEEYKNIKNQGFNFSPRFTCKYEDGELTIEEKKDYVSIFPKNINVTAIVGENGSGKSTIQKLIFLLIFLKKYRDVGTEKNPNNIEKLNALVQIYNETKLKNKNIFLIINTNSGLKKIPLLPSINESLEDIKKFQNSTDEFCLKDKCEELISDEIDFFSIHFNYMIDTWYDDLYDTWTNSIYHRVDGYDTPLLLEPYKGHEEDNSYIDISNTEYLNNGKIFDFYAQIKENHHINKFFNPDSIWMMINSDKLLKKHKKIDGFALTTEQEKVFHKFISERVKAKDLITLNKIYLAIKIISSKKEIFNDESIVQVTRDKLINIKTTDKFQIFLDEFDISDILKKTNLPQTQKIEACINFHEHFLKESVKLGEYKEFLVLDQSNEKINKLNEVFSIFNKIVPWIYIEFYDKDKSYNSLSSGEKMFLNFSINVMYQVRNIELLEKNPYKTINLFLDEVEFGLHPEWQKRFIQEVFYILKNFKSKFNLFYATHSPFILSDIPKENVIFLENGKQVYPNIETFGANIHTLLSHGFFMKNGLMGKFAKSKIDKAITILKKQGKVSKSSLEYCEQIISIIGEPILKRQLQRMLDSKRLYKMDEIDRLKADISELHQKLKRLEGRK